jgi:tetraacyldisaccharide 4'-kinase
VGNLNLGGVGKTPHVEYLIRLLKIDFSVAILSRGYKRKTSGFFLSSPSSTVNEIGDEPLQYKNKFNSLPVAVDEKRVRGIKLLKEKYTELNAVVLDDAFQHRSVKAGINILVTDFNNLYINDTVIPSGRLREWSIGSKRADIIIVSKTPTVLSEFDRQKTKEQLNPKPYQEVYFSFLKYGKITPFSEAAKKINSNFSKSSSVLLITGISNPKPLFDELNNQFSFIKHLNYNDHHQYSSTDLSQIKEAFKKLEGNNKIVITTEKDLMRLSLPNILSELEDIPLFYIPIEICFHGNDKEKFDTQIIEYVTTNSRN